MKYYSESTGGFYDEALHAGAMPDDVVDELSWSISYSDILIGQSKGLVITSSNGAPILVKPVISDLDYATTLLSGKMAVANQQIAIIKPAVDGGYAKPEHTQLLADWQRCRYELTLVPEQPGWPEQPQWPTEPEKVT